MGACVDNSRILMAATACVKAGGLGTDISDLPAAGAAPEWMSEKAIAIGQYFVTSAFNTMFGVTFPSTGSEILTDYLFKGIEEEYGGKWDFEMDPEIMAKKIDRPHRPETEGAGIDKARERVLMDMEMRRTMDAAAAGRRALSRRRNLGGVGKGPRALTTSPKPPPPIPIRDGQQSLGRNTMGDLVPLRLTKKKIRRDARREINQMYFLSHGGEDPIASEASRYSFEQGLTEEVKWQDWQTYCLNEAQLFAGRSGRL